MMHDRIIARQGAQMSAWPQGPGLAASTAPQLYFRVIGVAQAATLPGVQAQVVAVGALPLGPLGGPEHNPSTLVLTMAIAATWAC